MKDRFGDMIIGAWVGFMFAAAMFGCLTTPDRTWRLEAVKKGHAEYYFDNNYERQWRWR